MAANKTLVENIVDFGTRLDAHFQKIQEAKPPMQPVSNNNSMENMKTMMQQLRTTMEILEESMQMLEESNKLSAAVRLSRKRQMLVQNQLHIDMVGANTPLPAKRARKAIDYFKK